MADHLGVRHTSARLAIITGNPDRVPLISARFTDARQVAASRGFLCHEALSEDSPMLILASGIGAPSTAIVVEELVDLGVTTIVRLGTCGGLRPDVKVGDLVIPSGCVREEGTTRQYVPIPFPAVPDYQMLDALARSAARLGLRFHVGITHCKDAYYSELPDRQLVPERSRERWTLWRSAGVLATEMEASALFVLGSLRRIRTGAIFVNVGKVTPRTTFDASLNAAVEVIRQALRQLDDRGQPRL